MPRGYKTKKKATAKRYGTHQSVRGTNSTGRVTTNVDQSLTKSVGLPQCFNVKLRYVDHKVVIQATPYYEFVYQLNNLFDPQVALGGHQPMYYDSFAAIYNEYLVTSAKVIITVTQDNQQDSPTTVFWGVRDTTTVAPNPTISNCMEQGNRTIMQLGFASAGTACKSITQYTDIGKVHGIKSKLSPKNIPFAAGIGSGPAEGTYGILQLFSTDELSRVNCLVTVTIDYNCCFFNRKQMAEN